MLRIDNLNKTYPNGVKALDNVSLTIGKGIFGLLGPNGAGKSSLMRTIATLQEPDSGSISFEGVDVLQEKLHIRSALGYLPQEFGVYPSVSAESLLHHIAILKGVVDGKARKEMVDYLLDLTNLYAHRTKNLGGFSGGMKQRFGIAQALLGDPKLLIVDEPTAGLDPGERDRFYNLFSALSEQVTVILSTHLVSDVAALCSDLAIIQSGKVLLQASPLDAIAFVRGKIWKTLIAKSELESHSQRFQVISSRLCSGKYLLKIFSTEHPGVAFDAVDPDLEDVYFAFIKNYTRYP